GIDTAKNASQIIDKYFLESFNDIQSNINDYNQLNNIIKNIFIQLDTNLRELVKDHSGSIATLISPEKIFFINLGDSRGIIISNDGKVLLSTKGYLII
ncbi:unnamed protein product, partial [Rotaria sp. Silwood1]